MPDSLYQIAYYVVKKPKDSTCHWWQFPAILKCPLVCYKSLKEARDEAKSWKHQLNAKFQPIIIGETETDFENISPDCLFRINALRGATACEVEFPDMILDGDYW